MKYDELNGADKEAVDFLSKLESEGGMEAMWRWGGLKHAPLGDAQVWTNLAVALAAADRCVQDYAKIADNVVYEED